MLLAELGYEVTYSFSHIVQCIIIWGGASATPINKIRMAMNKIRRIFLHVKIYEIYKGPFM